MKDLTDRIRDKLLSDPKAKLSPKGDKINALECPECGKREAFAYYEKPFSILCHAKNSCGVNTPIKHLYPELFENFAKYYPPTPADPDRTAREYLQSRGLDTSRFSFKQSKFTIKETGKTYPSVLFEQDDVRQHRLIDYSEKDKNRTVTAFKNKVFQTDSVASGFSNFITEGVIDALSLAQAGYPAIATYSSGSVPEEFFAKNKHKNYIIAFDNDKAGKDGIEKTIKCLQELGIIYKVALPPEGHDWNDLLVSGELSDKNKEAMLEQCYWRGRLFEAQTPAAYFEILNEEHPQAIFEFKKAVYLGWFKFSKTTDKNSGKEDTERSTRTMQLIDCSLRLRYSIIDDSIQNNQQTTNIIEIESYRTKAILSAFNAKEMSSPTSFREKLAHYKQTSRTTPEQLVQIQQFLYDQKAPMVRKLQSIGYDDNSKCFVFSHFLYDKTGRRHSLNKHGFFSQHKIMPFNDELCIDAISEATAADVRRFIAAINDTFGVNGMMSLGFYISTLFSHDIFKIYRSFPILNLYHAQDTGKSTLINILNQMCGVDWPGIPIGGGNTKKGELRKISQKSSLVTPLSEWRLNSPKNIFDPASNILNAYNRLPLETRAQRTNGNETVEIQFKGALCFVQNDYPFMTTQEQERVIDLRFEEKSLNTRSDDFKYLVSLKPQELAGIGDFILKNREYFQDRLTKTLEKAREQLCEEDIKNRIALNHAVPYAGVHALATLVKNTQEPISKLFADTKKIALHKVRTAGHQLDIADYFFSLVDRMADGSSTGVVRDGDSLYLSMPTVLKHIKEDYNDSLTKDSLFMQLRSHERFVKANFAKQIDFDGDKKTIKVWEFKGSKDPHNPEPVTEKHLDYADLFLSTLESLSSLDGVVRGEPGDGHLYVNLVKVLAHIRNERMMRVDEPRLLAELRQHPRFVKSNHREANNPLLTGACWVFENAPI